MADLAKFIKVFLRLVFYMSGIFYSIPSRVEEPYASILLKLNPMAYLINALRDSILYCKSINYLSMAIFFIIGIILSLAGVHTICKHENNYVKVI